jgi:membrane-associated phospholipid phosphatase
MLTMVALTFSNNRWLTVTIVLFAWIVGFSRIYLLQHFLADVIAGSLVGVIIAFSSFIALGRWARGAIDSPQGLQ